MNGLRRFMEGRYGMDSLNIALLIAAAVLMLILSFVRIPWITLIAWIPLIYGYFRMFSRNIAARTAENRWFQRVTAPLTGWFRRLRARLADKEHRYFKCPSCANTLRVPKGRGKISITCPVCKTEFTRKS